MLLLLLSCGSPAGKDDPTTVCDETNESCSRNTCDGEGGNMLPGSDCLVCHGAGAGGEGGRFTAAGTAFTDIDGTAPLSGALVRITDAEGTIKELTTNSVGNFYTNQAFVFPIDAEIEVGGIVATMVASVDEGGCNSCHACQGAAAGKVTGP